MGAALAGPPLSDAERLLRRVRHLQPADFARTFRRGLSDTELLGVVRVLPAERLRALTDRARPHNEPAPGVQGTPDRPRDRPLATAIRTARQQAGIGQEQLARPVGVRQGAVSMWERGRTEPSGWRMAALLGVLPWLAYLLGRPDHPGGWAASPDAGELTVCRCVAVACLPPDVTG